MLPQLPQLDSIQPRSSFRFGKPSSGNQIPGLEIDSIGRTFIVSGNRLYRLSSELVEEEVVTLMDFYTHRGLALSDDDSTIVVCLFDLSCYFYNASNLNTGPVRTIPNAIVGGFSFALFMSGNSVYTASYPEDRSRMVLQQFGHNFIRSSDVNNEAHGGSYIFTTDTYRVFYGGEKKKDFVYYLAYDAVSHTNKLMRTCSVADCSGTSSCGINALYEGVFSCGSRGPINSALLRASIMNNFGKNGLAALVMNCRLPGCLICSVNITATNEAMDSKYDSCSTASLVSNETTDVDWDNPSQCSEVFQVAL